MVSIDNDRNQSTKSIENLNSRIKQLNSRALTPLLEALKPYKQLNESISNMLKPYSELSLQIPSAYKFNSELSKQISDIFKPYRELNSCLSEALKPYSNLSKQISDAFISAPKDEMLSFIQSVKSVFSLKMPDDLSDLHDLVNGIHHLEKHDSQIFQSPLTHSADNAPVLKNLGGLDGESTQDYVILDNTDVKELDLPDTVAKPISKDKRKVDTVQFVFSLISILISLFSLWKDDQSSQKSLNSQNTYQERQLELSEAQVQSESVFLSSIDASMSSQAEDIHFLVGMIQVAIQGFSTVSPDPDTLSEPSDSKSQQTGSNPQQTDNNPQVSDSNLA
ncbi:MAG: hypothetical protein PHS44_08320 [Candidatus Dojkabacteria bacterium]|nr:hypothetical protein [Candidatus Dojkabacteria bacterium]